MKALLFPGQGSQKTGMGKSHYDDHNGFRDILNEADRMLGYSLTELMFNGPAEKLVQTQYTQPAIFVHSYALFKILNITPDIVAGHSLGEFSALAAANVLPFDTTLALVAKRGELMQHAGEIQSGTMAAIIGLEDQAVEEICEEATEAVSKPVVPANYNCPGQLVISGDINGVKKAVELAKEKGSRLARLLPVSGAFHSPLMQPAFEELKAELENLDFNNADCAVYSNVTATPTTDGQKIKERLLKQLISPVRWTQTLQNMKNDGADEFTEIGPGNVLQGLVKRTVDNVRISGYQ